MPWEVVTVTSTLASSNSAESSAGVVTVMLVAEEETIVAALEPKSTALGLARSVPVIVTVVPPE